MRTFGTEPTKKSTVRYGYQTPRDQRDVTLESLSEGDVGRLMGMLGAMPGRQPIDYSMDMGEQAPPMFRFRNVSTDLPGNPRNIIRGQVYDTERGGYGGDVTLDQMLRMSAKNPGLAEAFSQNFDLSGADKKAFQKRFNSDPNFARFFVDLYGNQGEIGDVNAVDRGTAKADTESGYTSGVDRSGAGACLSSGDGWNSPNCESTNTKNMRAKSSGLRGIK